MGFDRWHRALAYALLGVDRPDLGGVAEPDVETLLAALDRDQVVAARHRATADDEPWPFPLPDKLGDGIAWARYGALLARIRASWGLDGTETSAPRPVDDARRPDPEQRRLLEDRPPHWG